MKLSISALVTVVGLVIPSSLTASFSRFDTPEKAITESENVLRIRVTRSVVIQELEPAKPRTRTARLRLITFRILSRYKQHPNTFLGTLSDVGMASYLTGFPGLTSTRFEPGKDYVICFDGDGATPTIRMSTAVFDIRDGKVFRPSVQGVFKESIKEFHDWMRPLVEESE